jgi:hypothetical protein
VAVVEAEVAAVAVVAAIAAEEEDRSVVEDPSAVAAVIARADRTVAAAIAEAM